MFIHILKIIIVFIVVLFLSSIISIPFMKNKILGGIITQIGIIVISLALGLFVLNLDYSNIGIKACSIPITMIAFILSILIALPLAYLSMIYGKDFEHPLEIKSFPVYVLVGLILSPIAEEIMFRGVLEGYLLATTTPGIAIILPSILFSIIHIAPFSKAPRKLLLIVLTSAFILGTIAGTFRYLADSIIPAIISHQCFNLAGKTIEHRK